MKRNFFYVSVLIALVFMACSSTKNTGITPNKHIAREWMLKKMEGANSDELLKAKAFINLSNLKQTSAKAGCNIIMFTTQLKKNNGIEFKGGGTTNMFCKDFMELEGKLGLIIGKIKSYEINGHFIKFKDGNGKVLVEAVAADWD